VRWWCGAVGLIDDGGDGTARDSLTSSAIQRDDFPALWNFVWDAAADAQLRWLARHRALPVTAMLEELVGRAERKALAGMAPAEERRYLRTF
jgi:hypothetical protein